METDLSANEDFLLPNIKLGLQPQASYVKSRRNATVHSSIATASPGGVSTIKWSLSSATEWLDPDSVVASFTVNNGEAKPLHPSTVGAHCLFERLQIRAGGQLIEDIDHFGRTTEIFERCVPVEKRINYGGLGFGQTKQLDVAGNIASPQLFKGSGHKAIPIANNGSKRVFMRFGLSGMLHAKKWIPLWAIPGGIEILLTLAPASEAVVPAANDANSVQYTLSDLRLGADLISIDPALDEQYKQNLLDGGGLKLHFKTWNVTQQYLAAGNAGNMTLTLSKAYSRLANVFANFAPELTAAQRQTGAMYTNEFTMFPNAAERIESFLTIGARKFPDFPNKGASEHYWRLMTSLGVALSLPHSINIDRESYELNSFLMGVELEKAPQVAASGENTTGGQEIAIHVKGLNDLTDVAAEVRRAFVILHHEVILDIMAGGVMLKT